MITGDKAKLDKLVTTRKCPEHDNPLVVVELTGNRGYAIKCSSGHFPEEILPMSEGQKRALNLVPKVIPFELTDLPAKDLATGEALDVRALTALVNYARRYGLDPYRGHVMIMHGKPYIGLDGYLYHARKANISYQLRSQPLSEAERQVYQLEPGDHAWRSEITILPSQALFSGMGIVTRKEMEEPSKRDPHRLAAPVVAAHPWQLAQKRAEWQALRRAFPIGVEADEDDGRQPTAASSGMAPAAIPAADPTKTPPPATGTQAPPRDADQDIKELWPE